MDLPDFLRPHQASPHCWCEPELTDNGVYLHRQVNMSETTERETEPLGLTAGGRSPMEERADEHLRVIEERWAYLSQRIIAKENVGWETTYDRAERDALDWVLFKLSGPDRDKADVTNAQPEGADA